MEMRLRVGCIAATFALILMAVLPETSVAQAAPADIVVTGGTLPTALGDAAYDIIDIDRDRLTSTASGRIEDVLRDVAGLQQFRRSDARSANATSQGATLRGLGGNASSRALLVLDGVPQTDPFGGWVTWPAFAPGRLGGIRVTRGGGSGVYGSGALAGTIELESAGPGDLAPVSGGISAGSRQSYGTDATLSAKLGGGFAFLSGDYARGDGFIPIVADQRGRADIAAKYRQASVAVRAVVPVAEKTELQASALAFTDRRTRGLTFTDNGGDGADASVRIVHRGDWGWSGLAWLQLRKFQSRAASIDAARTQATPTLDQYNVPSTGVGARFELRPPVGTDRELRIGSDWRHVTGETKEFFTYIAGSPTRGREAGGQSDTFGAFVEGSIKLGEQITLTAGGRIDRWLIRDGHLFERTLATRAPLRTDHFANRSGWRPTARGGVAAQVSDTIGLRGAAYLGWRLPTLNELYRPFRIGADATAANAGLSPERLKGAEIGLDWRPAAHVRISATAFSNRLNGAIANVTVARGPGVFPGVGFVSAAGVYRQRQNLDAIAARGIEVDANLSQNDWRLQASYAFTDAEVHASALAASLDGLSPAQVARHQASATLGWRWLSTTMRYVSRQFEDDQNQRRLRDAVTVDAVATIPLTDRLALSIRGENMTDTRVETAISASGVLERATPRTLWIGLRFGAD
jgi:vitamin B12 transporter